MRKSLIIAGLALAMATGSAHATGVGVGVYGGLAYPIVQDDVDSGTLLGLRVPVSLTPLITVEPFYMSSALGDKDQTLGGLTYTREGFDGKGYGLNAMLGSPIGMGVHFYPVAGIGKYKLERTGSEDIDEVGYNIGLGLGVGATPKMTLQLRGELNLVKTGDSSRKFANVTGGLTYSLMP